MFEETLYQKGADGRQFVDVLREAGIVPGIKVDTGLQARGVCVCTCVSVWVPLCVCVRLPLLYVRACPAGEGAWPACLPIRAGTEY